MRKLTLTLTGLALIAGLAHRAAPSPADPGASSPSEEVQVRTRTARIEAEPSEAPLALETDEELPRLEQDPRLPEVTDDSAEAWDQRHHVLHEDALADLVSSLEALGHDPARFHEVIEAASAERWSD